MKKLFLLTISAILYSFASFAQLSALSPSSGTICIGTPFYVNESDSAAGAGIWSSSNVAVATVGSTGAWWVGNVTGVSAGVVTITYTVGSDYVTGTYTVTTSPASITGGPTAFCIGSAATFADATVGGIWSSEYTSIATVGSTGVVTGVSYGTDVIHYTVSGCAASVAITVNATTVAPIDSSIAPSVCVGSTITLSDVTSGGTWSSSALAVVSVDGSTGLVTGLSAGTAAISYTVPGSCGAGYAITTITVSNTTDPGAISGAATVYIGGPSVTLNDVGGTSGGTWSSSDISIATIGSSSATVTAVAPGTTTITYSVSGCGGIATTTQVETVSYVTGITGYVRFTTGYYGNVKVWLITYNPLTYMLEAQDSLTLSCSGNSVYYQFTGLTTDSFRVKAAAPDSAGMITGPIPTYHDTSFYWDYASVIPYTTGASYINENINMLYGSTTGGPGFISGSVLTGANRGTSAGIPVVGLNMFALNTSTNTIAGMTSTDGSGSYSFSNLPYGTYTIFPDSLNYATTPYPAITLSASAATFSNAEFAQNLINKTIVPITEAVHNVATTVSSVATFPNPTSGKLNILWTEQTTEKATLCITDITGHAVYSATLNMAQGSGSKAIDLSAFTNGIYMISIKSASLDYNNKIEVLR